MKRNFLWAATALAIVVSVPTYQSRVAAQQPEDASAEADAQTDSSATADSSSTADAQQQSADSQQTSDSQQSSSTQSDAQATSDAATPSDAQSPTRSDASGSQSNTTDTSTTQKAPSSSTTSDDQSKQGTGPAPPAQGTETTAPQQQDRSILNQNQQPAQTDAKTGDRARADADISAQRRANADARLDQKRQNDFRRGINFGRATNRGLTIDNLEPNSIYFNSGFRRGDLIVSLHGRPIRSEADFMRFIVLNPTQRVPVVVLRGGRQETIYVQFPREVYESQRVQVNRPVSGHAVLGVQFDVQARDAAVVRAVTPGSPAEAAGLQRGDMIVALNGAQVMSYPEAISIVRSMQPGERLEIVLDRNQQEIQTEAILAGQSGGSVRTATRDAEIYAEREVAPAPPRDDRRIIINRSYDDDRRYYRDGDRDRPLRRRLVD